MYHGFTPPQLIYANRRFAGIALDPPDFKPGSWIGAGKAIYVPGGEFLLTARPRTAAEGVRGFAANIYASRNGIDFRMVAGLTKETASEVSGVALHSIEGTQLLKSPETGLWHFYLSVDTGGEFVWGGVKWETLLLTAASLDGPWRSHGLVLKNDAEYDAAQARDSTIDIVDGRWLCLYKAKDANRDERPALAVSTDGVKWTKKGPLTIDGTEFVGFLNGTIFAGAGGPIFVGVRTRLDDSRQKKDGVVYADEHGIGHGGGPPVRFVAYRLDESARDLVTIYDTEWTPLSPFEHREHSLLGYSTIVFDPLRRRYLTYVEAIDPELTEAIGINSTVERLLVYESVIDLATVESR